MRGLRWTFILLALAALACEEPERQCRFGSECASGTCLSDGTCAPGVRDASEAWDAGTPDASANPGADAAAPADAATPDASCEPDASAPDASAADAGFPDANVPADAAVTGCTPNGNGEIERAEAPFGPGLGATYRFASDAGIDTRGTPGASGGWEWDLSGALAGDRDVRVETSQVAGRWFASSYPGASYVSPMTSTGDILGVFELTADALLLRGMASASDGSSRTRIVYDPPVKVLAFPVRRGSTWSSIADVSGEYEGTSVYFLRHTYESEVDASGQVKTPLGTFPALRVRVVHKQQTLYWGVWTTLKTVRSFSFASECFGTVASVTSRDDETETEFRTASEVRRLAP